MSLDLPTMTMERWDASVLFGEYADSVRARNEKVVTRAEKQQLREDKELMNCYKWLSKHEQPIINIVEALKAGGVDSQGRPRLAVARADYRRVVLDTERDYKPRDGSAGEWGENVFFYADAGSYSAVSAQHDKANVVVPQSTFPEIEVYKFRALRAVVPTIPLSLRPVKLQNYHILWEADWEQAPVDPYLLKRVGHWHFAVMAQWDLTPLERGILNASRVQ